MNRPSPTRVRTVCGLVLAATLSLLGTVAAAGVGATAHETHDADAGIAAGGRGIKVSKFQLSLPEVTLMRADGKKVSLARELDDGRPVVLNFIYTTCPGICPMMSHTFSVLQGKLRSMHEPVHLVSISIDPEQDTPARLRDYAKSFSAGSEWQLYTGSVEASVTAQKAFGAYGGDKMSHDPVTFMRAARGNSWIRMDGFASADRLADEFTQLTSASATVALE
jgi:protein SCO1